MSELQRKQKSSADVFRGFAADTIERFPHLKGRLLIVDISGKRVYGANEIDPVKTGLTGEQALEYIKNHPDGIEIRDKGKGARYVDDARHKLAIIFINERIDENERNNVTKETEMHILFVLNHELGHGVISNGSQNDNPYAAIMAECIADAHALIRHYQSFGTEEDYHDKYMDPNNRRFSMMLGDKTHFTAFMLDEIVKHKDLIAFDKLSPEQTADLAWRFAMEFMPPPPVIEMLHKTFLPVNKAWWSSKDEGLKALIETTLNPEHGYYTFKFGSTLLKKYLDRRAFDNGDPINLPKEYLDDAARQLKKREFQFAKDGILLNIPKASRKPKPRPSSQPASPPQPGNI